MDDLELTIREVRAAIFALQAPTGGRGLRAAVVSLAAESADSLGFEPHVAFEGPVDAGTGEEAAEHLLSTLREALANVARHARAGRVDVVVRVGEHVELQVADDGVGPPGPVRPGAHGLRNMADRAEALGGSFALEPAPGGRGTLVTWSVPAASAGSPRP